MSLHLFCSQNLSADLPLLLHHIVQKFMGHRLEDPFRILCPSAAVVKSVEQALLSFEELGGVLTGKSVLTFEAFQGIYLEEEEEIPSLTVPWLLKQIWIELGLRQKLNPLLAENLFQLTLDCRKEGLTSADLYRFTQKTDATLASQWRTLWNAYDLLLRQDKTLWDEAKLSDFFFESLQKGKNTSLQKLESLYFIGFPLGTPSFKRSLQALEQRFSQLQILLWLSSGSKHPQDFIAQDWEDFQSKYIEIPFTKEIAESPQVLVKHFDTPFEEASFILQEIDEALAQGLAPEKILLVLPPSSFWKDYWNGQLRDLGFSSGLSLSKSLLGSKSLEESLNLEPQAALKQIQEKMKQEKDFDKLRRLDSWNKTLQELLFHQSKLSDYSFQKESLEKIAAQIHTPESLDSGFESEKGVQLCTWQDLSLSRFEKVFVFQMNESFETGKTLLWGKNLPLLKNRVFAFERRFDHLLNLASQEISFSTSELDAQGKIQSPCALLQAYPFEEKKQIVYFHPHQALEASDLRLEAETQRVLDWQASGGQVKDLQLLKNLQQHLDQKIFSPTQIEDFALCPFVFVSKNILKLKDSTEQDLEMNPLEKGNLLHGFLEFFFRKSSEEIFKALFSTKDRDLLKNSLAKEWENFALGFQKANPHLSTEIFEVFRTKALTTLGAILDHYWNQEEKNEKPLKPFLFEQAFSGEDALIFKKGTQEWKVQGKLDRVDVNFETGEFIIYDYKTGEIGDLPKEIRSFKKFQLPFYILAAKKILEKKMEKTPQFLGSLAIGLKKMEINKGIILHDNRKRFNMKAGTNSVYKEEELENYWLNLEKEVLQNLKKISSGDFRFGPEECPTFCAYQEVCRYHGRP